MFGNVRHDRFSCQTASRRFAGGRSPALVTATVATGLTAGHACAQWLPSFRHYTIERIALFGPHHTNIAVLQNSLVFSYNPAGFVAQSSRRFTDMSTFCGVSARASNSPNTTQISLTQGTNIDSTIPTTLLS